MKKAARGWLIAAAMTVGLGASGGLAAPFQHVLLVSVDGLHASDLAAFVAANPNSTLAKLSLGGLTYDHAGTTLPSDSFPGLLALLTGGTPKSTGVYYDDSYDRQLSAPGSNCSARGTEIVFDESLDLNMDALDAGGGLNPKALPLDPANKCAPVYPHSFVRVNTIFSVAHAAGLRTAWSDKHPSYDLVSGATGKDVDDLYTPEIAAGGTTGSIAKTEAYDDLKVTAVANQLSGKTSTGAAAPGVPAILGLNFQAVSVAEKLAGNGYDAKGAFSAGLNDALTHTDASLEKLVAALDANNLRASTLVIVTAKHGQSPLDQSKLRAVEPKALEAAMDAVAPGNVAQLTADDVALVWLKDGARAAATVAALQAKASDLGIEHIIAGDELKARYADPAIDSRAPDFIVQPVAGVIYMKKTAAKIAEHGGGAPDDVHVGLLVSGPGLTVAHVSDAVSTTQVAPTILAALGLDPNALQAVKVEGTAVLPYFLR